MESWAGELLYRGSKNTPDLEDFQSMGEEGRTPKYALRNPARRRAWDHGVSAWVDARVAARIAQDANLPAVVALDARLLLAGGVEIDGPDERGHVDLYGDKRTMLAAITVKVAAQEVLT